MCLGTANVFAMEDTATNSERADKAEKRQARIEEIAAKRGTTVSEVEAQFEAYKVEADALGITVKEYRVQLREEKLAEKAAERGVSVDELKAKFESTKAEADALGLTVQEYREQMKAQKLSEKQHN